MGKIDISIFVFILVIGGVFGDDDLSSNGESIKFYPTIMICVLARNKAHTLPYFLGQLEELDYPKNRLHLFIRSDHNLDETSIILNNWTLVVESMYASIDYRSDEDDVDRSLSYENESGPFDWTDQRYRRVIDAKEEALAMARGRNFDFIFFVDADNFLTYPRTLTRLIERKKSIIAPMLRSTSLYSNFWAGTDENGYYLRTDNYEPIYRRQIQDCFAVPMIHSTILIDLNDPRTTRLTFDRSKLLIDRRQKQDLPLDDVLIFGRSAKLANLELFVLNTHEFGFMLESRDPNDVLEEDVESMRYLLLETLFYGPPGLLHSPFLQPRLSKSTIVEPGRYFDQVYLINLRRRKDRRRRMEWCLDLLGINATWIEAVDGKKLTDAYVFDELGIHFMPEYKDPFHKRTMTHGEIGCFLSHYQIWQDVRLHNYQRVLILEDDLRFVKYFRQTLSILILETQERNIDWDLIYLGRKRLNPANDGPMIDGCQFLSRVGYSYWTLSYALSYDGAVKLLQADPFSNLVPVDEYLPIMFDRHPESSWKAHFSNRNLIAYTAEPLLVFPTHYTGEPGYFSDTENAPLVDLNSTNRSISTPRSEPENLMKDENDNLDETSKEEGRKKKVNDEL